MLYRIMISAVAEVTLYAEISASSREEANTLIQALNMDKLEGDIDTIREIGLTFITTGDSYDPTGTKNSHQLPMVES